MFSKAVRKTRQFLSSLSGRFITKAFIDGVIASGRLSEARERHLAGQASPDAKGTCHHRPTWELVCDEVIDTDLEPAEYDAIYMELSRRGFTAAEIDGMRRLAWETAGWLNYDMMVWDWCSLDESDMRRALDIRLSRRLCSRHQYHRQLSRIIEVASRPVPPLGTPVTVAGQNAAGPD